eukprot:3545769-Amphidinium_carterae.1
MDPTSGVVFCFFYIIPFPFILGCCEWHLKCTNRHTINRLIRNDVDLGVFQGRVRFLPSRQRREYVTLRYYLQPEEDERGNT